MPQVELELVLQLSFHPLLVKIPSGSLQDKTLSVNFAAPLGLAELNFLQEKVLTPAFDRYIFILFFGPCHFNINKGRSNK